MCRRTSITNSSRTRTRVRELCVRSKYARAGVRARRQIRPDARRRVRDRLTAPYLEFNSFPYAVSARARTRASRGWRGKWVGGRNGATDG